MAIIKTSLLSKKFRELVAVNNVSLEIEEGECFGLLGPNGAGKTSLIRMITAVSPPTAGDIWVLGKDVASHSRQIKAMISVIPQVDNLDPDLTTLQNLITFARYFSIPKKEALRRSTEVLTLLQLEEKRNSRINELSGGMKRRLLIARGLINNPKIIFLDEPTIGLDPQSKYLVWHKLSDLKSQGITQLLSTQNMEEANTLCDRVAIMHQGNILCMDTPDKLISKYAGNEVYELKIHLEDKPTLVKQLNEQSFDFDIVEDRIYIFHAKSEDAISTILRPSDKLKRRPATLEDVFFKLTGRSLDE
jgi:lipooligosaccharide transport system ATP-binding protein